MNSLVLPPSGLTGIHFTKSSHAPSLRKKAAQKKRFISGGIGLVLSLAFYWVLFNSSLAKTGSLKISAPADHAVYQWVGFYRVSPGIH